MSKQHTRVKEQEFSGGESMEDDSTFFEEMMDLDAIRRGETDA